MKLAFDYDAEDREESTKVLRIVKTDEAWSTLWKLKVRLGKLLNGEYDDSQEAVTGMIEEIESTDIDRVWQ